MFAGVQLVGAGAWGQGGEMNAVWDRLIAAGRLRAVVHDGLWYHLSRPADLAEAAEALAAQDTGVTT